MSHAHAGSHAASVETQPDVYTNPVWRYLVHAATIVDLELRKLRRDPSELIMRAVQPALWLLVFGQAFGRLRAVPTGGVPYLAFLTPGILAQSVTFISIFYGIAIIWERDMGILQKYLATPMRRSALVLGKQLGASTRAISQAVVILVLSWLVGVRLHVGWNVIAVLILVILGAAFFAGMSMVLAALLKTRERMMGIGQVITMPLFFSSNALYPISIMPAWLKVVATINPMTYLVDGLRGLLLGTGTHAVWADALILAFAGTLMLALASYLFPRRLAG
ncbi:ABC transporter permease [Alicyclobacillus macrosporangiidus]|uniref:Transport permease protein n=1 Tax=Alicyclobacillus macrosporangiidus TaxID=392015 RepID=A0A1I7HXW7_9BACL|nr:ABC transporter permease [Alicyclobacillus macrosporangiidus]SFU65564.1 ABC-2 type transport system permease protein [Alicyclobacillus macrosporangiidus]